MWTYLYIESLYTEFLFERIDFMKVYVLDTNGKPLMPTNPAKARKLLKINQLVEKLSV